MMPPSLPGSQGAATTRSRSSNRSSSGHHLTHTAASTTFHKRRRRRQQHHISGSHIGLSPGSYLALLLLSTTCTLVATSSSSSSSASAADTGLAPPDPPPASQVSISSSSPCAPQHWWDSQRDRCTPCTRCQGEMIPLRPCQLHTDTICGSIYDLKIDWVVLAKTEPNWKERRKSPEYEHFEHNAPLQHLTHEQLQQLHEEAAAAWVLDWQTGVLYVAVLTCLVFFSVAACILIHHMRQWRRMERRLDQDVEELSTKLMAKLAEVQSLDGGTFFIGNADALRGLPASAAASHAAAAQSGIFQPQHVLLPEKRGKHQERRILKTLQPGNVYIEESNAGLGGMGVGLGMRGGAGPKG
ncbi:tumor necrosis factor receptor superfamily member wengen [Drosophila subpulchrella]|uniref:tumor necrosis factor receptor superfamily member wengen n=1 Tax=Drosophila subpulchrella TaxID=1486046 RepID=UPI0018A1B6D4|nr:tumor necrosis factor receptor superfamily member wengen [Drosophila subpulchrella]